ncbi:MAG TPA: LuxR family transcriptional regulator, partial [Acidimicrobiia bacterium]|nr:LuxR family transcriptional regulator [Acidimicrobiia bacterium]
ELAATLDSPFLEAQSLHATGALKLADGDPTGALGALRAAQKTWAGLGVPYEDARTRHLIAAACRALGDRDGADLEVAGVRAILERLGAASPDRAHRDDEEGATLPDGLTPREVEVLRVVAEGKTNRVIAEELFISEKTVASHVSHIFTKLGVTSRAGATAYAYAHDLI